MAKFASISDVRARVGGRAKGSLLSETTTPSTKDVGLWLDEGEAFVTTALDVGDIPHPEVNTAPSRLLRSWIADYASAHFRASNAAAGGDSDNEDGEDLLEKFFSRIDDIYTNSTKYAAILGGGSSTDAQKRIRTGPLVEPKFVSTEEF